MSLRRVLRIVRIASPLVFASIGFAMLSACGQKGPLYLPDDKAPVTEAPASTPTGGTAPAPEKRDEEKEKPR